MNGVLESLAENGSFLANTRGKCDFIYVMTATFNIFIICYYFCEGKSVAFFTVYVRETRAGVGINCII